MTDDDNSNDIKSSHEGSRKGNSGQSLTEIVAIFVGIVGSIITAIGAIVTFVNSYPWWVVMFFFLVTLLILVGLYYFYKSRHIPTWLFIAFAAVWVAFAIAVISAKISSPCGLVQLCPVTPTAIPTATPTVIPTALPTATPLPTSTVVVTPTTAPIAPGTASVLHTAISIQSATATIATLCAPNVPQALTDILNNQFKEYNKTTDLNTHTQIEINAAGSSQQPDLSINVDCASNITFTIQSDVGAPQAYEPAQVTIPETGTLSATSPSVQFAFALGLYLHRDYAALNSLATPRFAEISDNNPSLLSATHDALEILQGNSFLFAHDYDHAGKRYKPICDQLSAATAGVPNALTPEVGACNNLALAQMNLEWVRNNYSDESTAPKSSAVLFASARQTFDVIDKVGNRPSLVLANECNLDVQTGVLQNSADPMKDALDKVQGLTATDTVGDKLALICQDFAHVRAYFTTPCDTSYLTPTAVGYLGALNADSAGNELKVGDWQPANLITGFATMLEQKYKDDGRQLLKKYVDENQGEVFLEPEWRDFRDATKVLVTPNDSFDTIWTMKC